jgi:TetR/AcrR family transcriptional repressor of nem operon
LETILRVAGVTKGAMYHHFASKEALGYAVVDEIIASITREKWLWPLQNAKNPIDALIGIIQSTSLRPAHLRCGCPLNNLSHVASELNERAAFRLRQTISLWSCRYQPVGTTNDTHVLETGL